MEVQQQLSNLAAERIGVVAVGFSPPARLEALRRELGLAYPLISDPERNWYAAFQVPRGRWRAVFAPRILRRYVRALVRGRGIPLPREDLRQLGAGVLLRGPTVLATWVTDESERRPAVAEVVAAARRAHA